MTILCRLQQQCRAGARVCPSGGAAGRRSPVVRPVWGRLEVLEALLRVREAVLLLLWYLQRTRGAEGRDWPQALSAQDNASRCVSVRVPRIDQNPMPFSLIYDDTLHRFFLTLSGHPYIPIYEAHSMVLCLPFLTTCSGDSKPYMILVALIKGFQNHIGFAIIREIGEA